MSELDARKQAILRAVVFEYVRGAEPIGSEMIASRYALGVRSATIRNEMAELSDQGFLEQPHTSAGRVPSDQGYRYYVDHLIVGRDPELSAKQKVKGAAQEGDALLELVAETAKLLSRITHLLSAASVARQVDLTVRSAVVSALGPKQALVVIVMSNGHVESRMVEVPNELTLTELGQANELLGRAVVGQTLRAVSKAKPPTVPENPATEKLLGVFWTVLKTVSRELNKVTVITEGEEFLLGQPEFQRDSHALAELLEMLQQDQLFAEALSGTPDAQPVTIGKENRRAELRSLSVVRRSFYAGDQEAGVIAVVGPTRMAYETSIPLVNFTAQAITDALTRYLG